MTVNRADRSAAELAQDVVREAQDLIHLELDLVKQELRELAIRNAIAIGLLAAGARLLLRGVWGARPVLVVVLGDTPVRGAAMGRGASALGGTPPAGGGRRARRRDPPRRTLASLE